MNFLKDYWVSLLLLAIYALLEWIFSKRVKLKVFYIITLIIGFVGLMTFNYIKFYNIDMFFIIITFFSLIELFKIFRSDRKN